MSKHKFKVGDQVIANKKAKDNTVTTPGWQGVADTIAEKAKQQKTA